MSNTSDPDVTTVSATPRSRRRRLARLALLCALAAIAGAGVWLWVDHRAQVAHDEAEVAYVAATDALETAVSAAAAALTQAQALTMSGPVVDAVVDGLEDGKSLLSSKDPVTTEALDRAARQRLGAATSLEQAGAALQRAREAHLLKSAKDGHAEAVASALAQATSSRELLTWSEGRVDDDTPRLGLTEAIDALESEVARTPKNDVGALDESRARLGELTSALADAHHQVDVAVAAREERLAAEQAAREQADRDRRATATAPQAPSSNRGRGNTSGSNPSKASPQPAPAAPGNNTAPAPQPAPAPQDGGWTSTESWDPAVTCVMDTEGNVVCG